MLQSTLYSDNLDVLSDLVKCEETSYNIYENDWMIMVEESRTQNLQDLLVSDYVKWSLNKFDHSILAKLRCGIVQFRVETGRFVEINLEDRTCQICNLAVVEDKFHFLYVCDIFNDLREIMFDTVSHIFPIVNNMDIYEHFIL